MICVALSSAFTEPTDVPPNFITSVCFESGMLFLLFSRMRNRSGVTKTPNDSVRRPVFFDNQRFCYFRPSTKPSRDNPEVVVMDIVPKPCLHILGDILCHCRNTVKGKCR